MREKNGGRAGGGGGRGPSPVDRGRRDGWGRPDNNNAMKHGMGGGRRSRSRSPIKSKLMALAMQAPSSKLSKGVVTGANDRGRGRDKSRRDSRDSPPPPQQQQRRLRMDEMDGANKKSRKAPSPPRRPDGSLFS
jgi:hypothetical protein